jgi:hypothetical protein
MLILDKPRALDRMLYLSDRRGNTVPTEFLRTAPLRWMAMPTGRRALAGEVVLLRPARALPDVVAESIDRELETLVG